MPKIYLTYKTASPILNPCKSKFLSNLGKRDCAFFADGIIFRPGLPYGLRRSFLSECEGRLRDEEGCIGATLVSTASPESLLKYGYVPFDRQVLGVEPYVETDLSPRNLRGLRIELR